MSEESRTVARPDCEQVIAALEGYLAGTLPLAELLPIAEHVESCLPCMHRLELRRASLAVLISSGGDGDARADGGMRRG